jgi:hypothetical protein
MGSWTARLLDLGATAGRQVVPLNGILGGGWQPVTAIAIYWLESVALAIVAAILCWRLQRRTSDRAIAAARAAGDETAAVSLEAERQAANQAGIKPADVLMFNLFSLAVFGVFIGIMLVMLIQKGYVAPFNMEEFRGAADGMLLVLGLGGAIDLVLSPSMSVAAVQGRVNSCLGRWALLWMLCFFGTILLVFTGRPGVFLGMFAVLKAVWEGWATLARIFGWKSMQETSGWKPISGR